MVISCAPAPSPLRVPLSDTLHCCFPAIFGLWCPDAWLGSIARCRTGAVEDRGGRSGLRWKVEGADEGHGRQRRRGVGSG